MPPSGLRMPGGIWGAAAIMLSAMSSDKEDRDPVRRSRVIKRPYVPAGRLADLKALIYELYLAAETPTLDEITNRVDRSGGDLVGNPGRDTINRIIGDPGMPAAQADVVAVVTVLAREACWDVEDAVMRARDLWIAARMASTRTPAGGVRVSQADPRRLGVHAAISVPEVPDQVPPDYVPRDADDGQFGVRAKVAAAAKRGGFVLLVGGSSVGKSRSALEAVTALLPDWWLVHPAGPGEVAALATAPAPRTVVWLDELQRYLDGAHGLTGAEVRALLNAPDPVVIIGTIWPDRYTAYAAVPISGGSDPHARERQVLDLADVVRVAAEFSPAEQDRAQAAAARDPRLRVALKAPGYGLTQTLAAAPQLVAHWQDARTASPYAWAVLTAALDAARLGARAPLSAEFLRAAAPGYCTSQQRAEAPGNWFEQALAYATANLHGAAAALSPAGVGMGQVAGYTGADYLVQHARRERRYERLPASTWVAVLSHVRDPADAFRLADSARSRLLYRYAIPLYRHAADGDDLAAVRLAELLAERGDLDEATQILRARADADYGYAAWRLAELLAQRGDLDGLRARADGGDSAAARRLASLLVKRGDVDGAARILRALVDSGDQRAASELADLLAGRSDLDGVRAWADAVDQLAASVAAGLLAKAGDQDGLRALADAGDQLAASVLAGLLAKAGDLDGLRALADAGNQRAALELAGLLAERGDRDEATRILRHRADAGDRDAARRLADLMADRLMRQGRGEEAERLRRFGLNPDGSIACG